MKVSKPPVTNGRARLSFIGNGRLSINIATAAPDAAINGFTKNAAAEKAKTKPMSEPSSVFPLLNASVFLPNNLPKIEAVLSPSEKITIAALPA
jgi:hypothetical protein